MKQEEGRQPISRKPFHGNQINGKLIRWRKINTSFSPSKLQKKDEVQRTITLKINEQSISFIAKNQEGSFISNGQDRSIDSFDKMIIGVEEVLDLEDNGQSQDPNYSFLYKEYQRLCKQELKSRDSNSEDNSISAEEVKNIKEQSWEEPSQSQNLGRVLRQKIEEVKEILRQRGNYQMSSDPNISMRLLGANLSEIHQEEIQHDSSMHRMDPIEEEFIDFVSKGEGQNKINISKIEEHAVRGEKKVSFKGDILKQNEEDEVVAMLENELVSRGEAQEESITEEQNSLTKKQKKENFIKQNYNQILSELDQNEEKKLAASYAILAKRAEWIKSRHDKSERWKKRETELLSKFRDILQNPYAEHSDQEEFQFQEL